jgi:2-polyprenyl-3-methyl-5-hydroxy-6-metoxy-1,4-benzoquinol methylase
MALTEAEVAGELERLRPFHHSIDLPYGLNTFDAERSRRPVEGIRVDSFVAHAFPSLFARYGGSLAGKRVLDVGCNCGGFSFEAAKAGAERVVGIDIAERYIEQADFIRQTLDANQTEFSVTTIDDVSVETVGSFDVVLCLGVLYHLENPVSSMRRLAAVCEDAMLVDTNITENRWMRKPYWRTNVPPPGHETGTTGAWRADRPVLQSTPNAAAVFQLLTFLDFAHVTRLPNREKTLDGRYQKGRRATFLALRA